MRLTVMGLVIAAFVGTAYGAQPLLERVEVFEAGKEGYTLYRIPGLAVTKKGTVVAYCEGRRGGSDWSAIDLMIRRSTDGGKTWGPCEQVASIPGPIKKNPLIVGTAGVNPDESTYNNPVAIAHGGGV